VKLSESSSEADDVEVAIHARKLRDRFVAKAAAVTGDDRHQGGNHHQQHQQELDHTKQQMILQFLSLAFEEVFKAKVLFLLGFSFLSSNWL